MDTHTKMRELSLFSGAGGGLLGTKHLLGWDTVCYVEFAKYPQEILKARIRDGMLDDAPIWDDVTTFDGRPWRGCVDIVTAGFPCQPFSTAGKRQADGDSRNMWPDTIRIIREVKPKYCFLENVPGLLSATDQLGVRYFGTILGDLAESGYDARWRVLSAAEVGAPHKRDRLWIVAYNSRSGAGMEGGWSSRGSGQTRQPPNTSQSTILRQEHGAVGAKRINSSRADVAYSNGRRLQASGAQEWGVSEFNKEHSSGEWWQTEPNVGRVVDGMASRVDRLKAIGNGQVPLCAAVAWQLLTEPDSVDGAGG